MDFLEFICMEERSLGKDCIKNFTTDWTYLGKLYHIEYPPLLNTIKSRFIVSVLLSLNIVFLKSH